MNYTVRMKGKVEEKTSEKIEIIPFKTIRQANDQLEIGVERVVTKGVDGELTEVYKEIYQDGKLVSTEKNKRKYYY